MKSGEAKLVEVLAQIADTNQIWRQTVFDCEQVGAVGKVAAVVGSPPSDLMCADGESLRQGVLIRLDIKVAVVEQVNFVGIIEKRPGTTRCHSFWRHEDVAFRATVLIEAKRVVDAGRYPSDGLGKKAERGEEQNEQQ